MAKARPDGWLRLWFIATAAAAALVTAMDAVLLQLRRSYFTGGFLSVDAATDPVQAAGFVLGSLLVDAAAMGLLVAVVLSLAGGLGVGARGALVAAVVAAITPVAISNFISYRLASFLGDAFDLGLMFELVGGDLSEIFAVASEHITRLLWTGAGSLVVGTAGIWWIRRVRRNGKGAPVVKAGVRRVAVLIMVLGLAGTSVTAALRLGSDVLDNGLRRKPTGQAFGMLADTLSDFDRDGYGILGRPADPAPFDARIYPWAVDIPGNGVDENGVGGDLPVEFVSPDRPVGLQTGWVHKPNVLLIVLESFRADAVGAIVNGRSVTPVLDALGARGVSSQLAYSHNGYTVQSRYSLLSGNLGPSPDGTSLIDDFKANGYETAYFSAQDESYGSPEMTGAFGSADFRYDARQDVDRRFTTFTTPGSLGIPHDVLNQRVAAFLDSRSTDRPVFLYVNFYDTHFPYHHAGLEPLATDVVLPQAQIGPDRAAELREMYLNAVANVDRAAGALIEKATMALGVEPAVIVTADHGESLFDEGFLGHGYALNDVQTRVPLIVAGLSLVLEEPVGQASLRRSVSEALSGSDPAGGPVIERPAGNWLFRYLGNLERPARIGVVSAEGTLDYDFRSGMVSVDGAAPQRTAELDQRDAQVFLELLRRWERLVTPAASRVSR